MSQINIKELFDESRFPSGWKLVALFLYTPLGIVLVLLRLLIGLQLWLFASLLPDCDTLRTCLNHGLTLTFGIIVRVDMTGEERDKKSRIIVANNVSALDHFALRRNAETVTPSLWELPNALSHAMGLQEMNMNSKDALIANIKHFLSSSGYNIALQPEFGSTNSRVALLKFNSWPFSIQSSIQPVVIKTQRPEFVGVKLTSVASTWWMDVFWFMFVPYTIFTLRYLKVKRNMDSEVLAREVEREIADTLGIQTSNHTVSDKTEYEKRYVLERTRSGTLQGGRTMPNAHIVANAEMRRMAHQVSEVFPLVPYNVIIRDLLKTRSVDVTISNILEGIVTYVPEPAPTNSASTASVSRIQSNEPKSGSSSGTLSFQERKAKMIAEARERYIQKHGLPNC
ncbi:lipid droplet-regulating VLDL assembly factor AUP1-like isoform X1 [Neodiprion pinetum]|uniref:Lipid droplet-regulating VLDL assembly factor AUP1 n=2 Tax=Neodiprion lecontei TaxID=441921 RepID=A0A6J0CCS4_NEOLC|nr:lipid droplet-regulating VLDL assembly factor AUP1 isoform X1 [Neodiprion lecontei]XP_046418895.1 lipid droplet-regulating VLDL assembly factor AUP1-like isoform X1 [Neodiprion fabricii]XP_046474872.1 lipid droplet-regulating VLDL assembly factor AUP1-like isoform X1 [Neodiprion pinetum]XP_046474873.1 lipid droplet-regulating VLDL assembly factor AUP1-like isoform X1 [Neodiprion pinetum]XP_046612154.1 lipid droplet-regulating VLDL assembly factor AUP1-like isoform X1 [Neodiprion virginianus]